MTTKQKKSRRWQIKWSHPTILKWLLHSCKGSGWGAGRIWTGLKTSISFDWDGVRADLPLSWDGLIAIITCGCSNPFYAWWRSVRQWVVSEKLQIDGFNPNPAPPFRVAVTLYGVGYTRRFFSQHNPEFTFVSKFG